MIFFIVSGKTKELETVIKDHTFIVSLRHIKPRKRSRGLLETLFAVDFPQSDNKFSLLLDRKVKKGEYNKMFIHNSFKC